MKDPLARAAGLRRTTLGSAVTIYALRPRERHVAHQQRGCADEAAADHEAQVRAHRLHLLQQALPAIKQFGLKFLIETDWNPVTDSFGALPAIFGTVSTHYQGGCAIW